MLSALVMDVCTIKLFVPVEVKALRFPTPASFSMIYSDHSIQLERGLTMPAPFRHGVNRTGQDIA